MIKVFYNLNGQAEVSESLGILKKISLDDALWLDLFSPTGEEKRAVESFLHTTLQSRAQAEEIESSSRYSETVDAIFANTNFLIIPSPPSGRSPCAALPTSSGVSSSTPSSIPRDSTCWWASWRTASTWTPI